MSSPLVSPPVVKVKALFCPNCGGPVELRGFAHTLTVVCPQCLTVLDATTPTFSILHTFQAKTRVAPKVPLGARGKLDGVVYQTIGFQVRSVGSGTDSFTWDEYVLFNPYQGFRYLSEFQGHWNFIRGVTAVPQPGAPGVRSRVVLDGRAYTLFDRASAVTAFVLGEFPWRVALGDRVIVEDHIAPPYMLSSESTSNEVTWSRGEYRSGAEIWKAFQLPGNPPPAVGIFANQPSPLSGGARSIWKMCLWLMAALAGVAFLFSAFAARREVFRQDYAFASGASAEPSFVTPAFDLAGRPSNVELRIQTDLDNNWAYFSFALINEQTQSALDFGREVSYYKSGDETEGRRSDRVILPAVPSGRYYLRVEPEMNPQSAVPVHYSLALRRDVPNFSFFWLAALLLLIPPAVASMRAVSFESVRWRESDFLPARPGGTE